MEARSQLFVLGKRRGQLGGVERTHVLRERKPDCLAGAITQAMDPEHALSVVQSELHRLAKSCFADGNGSCTATEAKLMVVCSEFIEQRHHPLGDICGYGVIGQVAILWLHEERRENHQTDAKNHERPFNDSSHVLELLPRLGRVASWFCFRAPLCSVWRI